jgi:hypothetical protein
MTARRRILADSTGACRGFLPRFRFPSVHHIVAKTGVTVGPQFTRGDDFLGHSCSLQGSADVMTACAHPASCIAVVLLLA